MTFTVSSKAINEALNMVLKVITPKNAMPILDDFIFALEDGTLSIMASDAENIMKSTVSVTDGQGEGRFAINAKNMMEAMKNMNDMELTFDYNKGDKVKVTYLNGMFTLPTDNADEFPQPYDITPTLTIDISETLLQENIARSIFAAAQDELRPIMNGIFFDLTEEALNIVATNGHQLVKNKVFSIKATEDNKGSLILPKKPANILKNLLRKVDTIVTMEADNRWMKLTTEKFTLRCRLIEGRYPNYNSVIPKNNDKTLTVDRNNLIAVLKRLTPFACSGSELMKIHVQQDNIRIETEDFDFSKTATETMAADYDGKDMNIGFKSSALLGVLDNIKSTNVQILLYDPSRAGLIQPSEQPEQQEILMLLMPMLLND